MKSFTQAIVCGAALLTVPAIAVAEDAPLPPGEDVRPRTMSGDLEVGVFAESRPEEDIASVSPMLRLGLNVRPSVELRAAAGAATLFKGGPSGRETVGRPSNVMIGTRFIRDRPEPRHRRGHIGFTFAIPTGSSSGEFETRAYEYALGSRGGWNPWEWAPSTMGLVIPAAYQGQVWRRLVLGIDGAIAGLFAGFGSGTEPAFAGQVAGKARYAAPWFGVGARIQAVYNGRHPDDRFQSAVVPFVDTHFCKRGTGRRIRGVVGRDTQDCPLSLSAKVAVNLDRPYGFVGDDGLRVWGLTVGLGWAVY